MTSTGIGTIKSFQNQAIVLYATSYLFIDNSKFTYAFADLSKYNSFS